MKWKDNLIYEFINQIISRKWILKPETLWWLNRRENVFSLPCVEESRSRKVVLAEMVERTCAINRLAPCSATHRPCCFLNDRWELFPSTVKPQCSELTAPRDPVSFLVTLPAGISATMPTSPLSSKESGVLFGACLSLHPKNIGRSAAGSQVPAEPRKTPPTDASMETTRPGL